MGLLEATPLGSLENCLEGQNLRARTSNITREAKPRQSGAGRVAAGCLQRTEEIQQVLLLIVQ
jgi:hypothetical protein